MLLRVVNGKGKDDVIQAVQKLDSENVWEIKITKKHFKRSVSQNNLYWLWLSCLEKETGNDRNDLHEFFKAKFLGFEEIKVFDHVITRVVSTTEKDTLQFKEYLDKIQMFASMELGIQLPDPEDKYWNEFYEAYKYMI